MKSEEYYISKRSEAVGGYTRYAVQRALTVCGEKPDWSGWISGCCLLAFIAPLFVVGLVTRVEGTGLELAVMAAGGVLAFGCYKILKPQEVRAVSDWMRRMSVAVSSIERQAELKARRRANHKSSAL